MSDLHKLILKVANKIMLNLVRKCAKPVQLIDSPPLQSIGYTCKYLNHTFAYMANNFQAIFLIFIFISEYKTRPLLFFLVTVNQIKVGGINRMSVNTTSVIKHWEVVPLAI